MIDLPSLAQLDAAAQTVYAVMPPTPQYRWPLSSLLRGCLLHFDLPEVYASLGGRIAKSQPWDARMQSTRVRK